LTNVVKHAGADQAHVRAVAVGDQLQLEVADNGRGGQPDRRIGTDRRRRRVDAAGGSMSLTSPPDVSTRLSVAQLGRH
jgi:signal transduction histidine kinase